MDQRATMRAAQWCGRQDLRIVDVALPAPRPDQALVRILYCGVCGTDLEEYRDGPLTVPVTHPHPVSGRLAPMTLGHEMVGVIEAAAIDGSGPPVGTVVIPDVVVGCGACWWCAHGDYGLCERLNVLGQTDDGGLAEYMPAVARTMVIVPQALSPFAAVLAEPVSVAIRAVRKAGPVEGRTVAVVGGGTIGQLVAQILVLGGAARTIVVDPSPSRRSVADRISGVSAVAPDAYPDLVAALPSPGLDVVFECTGRAGVLAESLRFVRRGGLVVAVGLRSGDEPVPVPELVLGEKRVVGTAAHNWDTDVTEAVELLASGTLDVEPFLRAVVPLAELVTHGLPLLGNADAPLKVVVDCS